jgi:segregation and condensation protein B
LVVTSGRKSVVGRPILYRTSKDFLVHFGLKDVGELPSLKEFEELAKRALGSEWTPGESPAASSEATAGSSVEASAAVVEGTGENPPEASPSAAEEPAPVDSTVAPETAPARELESGAVSSEAAPDPAQEPVTPDVAETASWEEPSTAVAPESDSSDAELPAPNEEMSTPVVDVMEAAPEDPPEAPLANAVDTTTSEEPVTEAPPSDSPGAELAAPSVDAPTPAVAETASVSELTSTPEDPVPKP